MNIKTFCLINGLNDKHMVLDAVRESGMLVSSLNYYIFMPLMRFTFWGSLYLPSYHKLR